MYLIKIIGVENKLLLGEFIVKIALLAILFTTSFMYAQESVNTTNQESQKKEKKPYVYQPHSIGISTRLGAAHRFNVYQNSSLFLNTTVVDFYAGKRIGKTKYNSLIQFRFSTPVVSDYSTIFPLFNEFRWGLLLGGSQYAFDFRTEQGTGWSMMVNGGMSFDLPTIPRFKDLMSSLVIVGVEIDIKSIYNFSKYNAIIFGLNLGYHVSYTYRSEAISDDEGFALPMPLGLYIEHAFVWGFSVGILF